MKRFYVYTIKDDDPFNRDCLYVDEVKIEEFALVEFESRSMIFSGVLVEADNPHHAHEIYNLNEKGEILWVDEPKATLKKREVFEAKAQLLKSKLSDLLNVLSDAEKAASRLAINALIAGIELHFEKINKDMSYMARLVQRFSKDPAEIIYLKIKKKYLEQLRELQYKADPGSGG